MTQTLDIAAVASNNPNVDPVKVNEALKSIEELKEKGIVREKEYDLASPFSRPTKPTEQKVHRSGRFRLTVAKKDR